MPTESIIISAICGFFAKLGESYGKSAYHKAFCRLFDVVGAFFGRIFGTLFAVSDREKHSHCGVFSRLSNAVPAFFYHIFSGSATTVSKKSDESFIVRIVRLVFESWHLISIRNYSTVLLSFTLVRLAIIRIIGRANDKYTLAFLIISAIGMCIPASFAGLYQGSLIRRQLGLFDLKDPAHLSVHTKAYIATTCSLVLGALLGVAILLPYWHLFVLCVVGIVFVFTKPNLSALLIVAVSPLVSENVFFVLAIILAAVWSMRYFASESADLHIDGLDVCVIFAIITAICSSIASPVMKSSFESVAIFLLCAMLYFILRKAFADKNNIRLFIDFIVIICGIIAFSHLYRLTFAKSVFDKERFYLLHSMEQNLRSATGANTSFGEIFAIILPFALCRMKMHRAFFGKLLYLFSAVLMSACVFLSYKHCTALIILVICMVIVSDFRRIASFIAVPAIAFAVAVIYGVFTGSLNFEQLSAYSFNLPLGNSEFVSMLLYGVGFGADAFRCAYAAVFGDIPPGSNVMSLYTSILLASGITGIVIFAATVRTAFSYAGKSAKLSDIGKTPVYNAFIISVISFILTGFIPSKTYSGTEYMLFFTLTAMAGAMLDTVHKKEER